MQSDGREWGNAATRHTADVAVAAASNSIRGAARQ